MVNSVQNLNTLFDIQRKANQIEELQKLLVDRIEKKFISLQNLQPSGLAFFIFNLKSVLKCHHLILCQDREQALYFLNDLENISESREWCNLLPEVFRLLPGGFSYEQSHQVLVTESLIKLQENNPGVWITYPEAFSEKHIISEAIEEDTIKLKVGDLVDLQKLVERLLNIHFKREDFVYEPGTFALRGGILDIFSYGNENPYRIEFFDDEIDSIRIFNPETQLSEKKLIQINLIPNTQKKRHFSEKKKSYLELFPQDTLVWSFDFNKVFQLTEDYIDKLPEKNEISLENEEDKLELTPLDFISKTEFENSISNFNVLDLSQHKNFSIAKNFWKEQNKLIFEQKHQPSFNRNFNLFKDDLQDHKNLGYQIFLSAENPKQLVRIQAILDDLESGIQIIPLPIALSQGFIDVELKYLVYTDHQIFQRYHKYRVKQVYNRNKAISLRTLQELTPGDFVVHIDHGIGVYSGLQKINVNGSIQEAVRIIYRDNDVLYVNVNSLHKISRYTGKEGTPPKVNKIGSDAWDKIKTKTKRRIKELAVDLIKLYAKRKTMKGFGFSPDTYMQTELEASFFYEDTPDQSKSTIDVKEDMEKDTPMDRLICGDVGFGKTEVAVRAAFKCVADSKQVAILVPTTILAYQHYQTFKNRLEEFPCNIDYINRFKSTKQKNETFKKLKEGSLDIVIGTHAILSDKIEFKDLGLLIIDEEQKFGVGAKEKLRAFRAHVDTLTLTATPIPRTLQFSLMGVRDMSVMATPPNNRQPVHTEIITFSEEIIKEAITYEVERGGQIYFVHNRVQSLDEIAVLISKLCPQAKVAKAHGQMEGSMLENILVDFIEHKFDVLVSTNIIESGVDIPNANTIFINNAHQFGLSDLHQMRGRVGRSNKKSFCYLVAPPLSILPNDSKKRLTTLEEFNELGSGFQIAMRDLDIRGAGDLLGAEQSGFIAEIGFDMYHKILNQAVKELKKDEYKSLFEDEQNETEYTDDCLIDTDLEILIPDEYVSNIQERFALYTRLDNSKNEEELQDFKKEMEDRFGALPIQVINLLDLVRCRWIGINLGIEKITLKNKVLRFYFVSNPESSYFQSLIFQNIMSFVQKYVNNGQFKHIGTNFMLIIKNINSINELLSLLLRIKNYSIQEIVD